MRETKFRQWIGKRFHYWGFLNGAGCFTGPIDVNIDNEQFTGLKDQDGKEIYEGDILKIQAGWEGDHWIIEKIRSVEYFAQYGEAGFIVSFPDGIGFESCKVIGNIHENPDVLKEA